MGEGSPERKERKGKETKGLPWPSDLRRTGLVSVCVTREGSPGDKPIWGHNPL